MKLSHLLLLAILSGTFCITNCKEIQDRQTIDKSTQDIENESNKLAIKAEKEGGLSNEDFDSLSKAADKMADTLESMGGEKAAIGRVIRKITQAQEELNSTLDASIIEEAMDFNNLYQLKDYDSRLNKVRIYAMANQSALTYAKDKESISLAKKLLQEEKVNTKMTNEIIRGMTATVKKQLPHIIKIRDCDTALCDNVSDILKLLKEHDGKWNFDKKDQMVIFTENSILETFNSKMENIYKIGTEQSTAQVKLLSK